MNSLAAAPHSPWKGSGRCWTQNRLHTKPLMALAQGIQHPKVVNLCWKTPFHPYLPSKQCTGHECAHMYMQTHVCTHAHTEAQLTCAHRHTMHTHVCTHTLTHVHTHVHTHTSAHTPMCTHTCTLTFSRPPGKMSHTVLSQRTLSLWRELT